MCGRGLGSSHVNLVRVAEALIGERRKKRRNRERKKESEG